MYWISMTAPTTAALSMVQAVMHNLHKIGGMAERRVYRAHSEFDALIDKRKFPARRAAIADARMLASPLTEPASHERHTVDTSCVLKIRKCAPISETGRARERRSFARKSSQNNHRLQI